MIKQLGIAVVAACVFLVVGCGGKGGDTGEVGNLVGQGNVKTLVGLHPDQQEIYAMHYQMPGYIPAGTDVTVTDVSGKRLKFTDNSTGQQYTYLYHGKLGTTWADNLAKTFGTNFDKSKIDRLSDVDKKGIKEGRIYPGMSKEGVILVAGYPPLITNPMDRDDWQYWKNRFANFRVVFDNGKVKEIVGAY